MCSRWKSLHIVWLTDDSFCEQYMHMPKSDTIGNIFGSNIARLVNIITECMYSTVHEKETKCLSAKKGEIQFTCLVRIQPRTYLRYSSIQNECGWGEENLFVLLLLWMMNDGWINRTNSRRMVTCVSVKTLFPPNPSKWAWREYIDFAENGEWNILQWRVIKGSKVLRRFSPLNK